MFSPPYLFNEDNSRATRPVMTKVPEEIRYREHFDITVAGDPRQIASVVLLRSDHNTHSLTAGDRYVKLAFRLEKGDDDEEDEDDGRHERRGRRSRQDRELRITAPRLQGQAVPGIYVLFIVDKNGTPSEGRRVDIRPDTRGNHPRFK